MWKLEAKAILQVPFVTSCDSVIHDMSRKPYSSVAWNSFHFCAIDDIFNFESGKILYYRGSDFIIFYSTLRLKSFTQPSKCFWVDWCISTIERYLLNGIVPIKQKYAVILIDYAPMDWKATSLLMKPNRNFYTNSLCICHCTNAYCISIPRYDLNNKPGKNHFPVPWQCGD